MSVPCCIDGATPIPNCADPCVANAQRGATFSGSDGSIWILTGGDPCNAADWTNVEGCCSTVTDNGDGTYTHNDGQGNVTLIDTVTTNLPFDPTIVGCLTATTLQGAIDELSQKRRPFQVVGQAPDATNCTDVTNANNIFHTGNVTIGATAPATAAKFTVVGSSAMGANNHNAVGTNSSILSGSNNTITATNSGILSGNANNVSGNNSAILSGTTNTVSGPNSIAGGNANTVSGTNSIAFGNNLTVTSANTALFGSSSSSTGDRSLVSGFNNIANGANSLIASSDDGQTSNTSNNASIISSSGGTINNAANSAIIADVVNTTITGGFGHAAIGSSTININGGQTSTSLGTDQGTITGSAQVSSIASFNSTINASVDSAMVGTQDSVLDTARWSGILGGFNNDILNSDYSVALGGINNTVNGSVIGYALGGDGTVTGDRTFLFNAGNPFTEAANQRFTVVAPNGIYMYTDAAATQGRFLAGGANWNNISDSTLKENIVAVDVDDIASRLANLNVYKFNFIGDTEQHIGIMADDWNAEFSDLLPAKTIEINGQTYAAMGDLQVRGISMAANMSMLNRINNLEAASGGGQAFTELQNEVDTINNQLTALFDQRIGLKLTTDGNKVTVEWLKAFTTTTNVKIYRNGNLLVTTNNDGKYDDTTVVNGQTYSYYICDANNTICSSPKSITVL